MLLQQSKITNVTSVVDNLPGVSVQEGDAYGFDDWSSNVAMRGFQVTINDVQIGTTIDGFPNGTSDYWSGAKANRFVDPMNLGGVEVSQGTADIGSRSVEALGGTFNYLTDDPADERSYTASMTLGQNQGQRFFMRVDTGPIFGGNTRAWFAATRQEATDWMEGSALNSREHLAMKLVSSHGRVDLTSYVSYDNIHEDVYQRLYSESDFRANPRWDRLIGDWPGVPYLNQFYRRGWQTRRSNAFGYLKADWSFGEELSLSLGGYFHRNRGRGDWLPPYIVDITDDGGGAESELLGGPTVRGGSQRGLIRFVGPDGAAVGPVPGCTSSFLFNYYGPGGPEVDPACHPGATAVQSYRHSHYAKDRVGITLDEEWLTTIGDAGSKLRAGIWYEDSKRGLGRDWHQILDPSISFQWHATPYWHQYEWDFPQSILMLYAEETLYVGLQYSAERVALSATGYVIDFDNRIFYLGPQMPAGPNYLIPGGGAYFNAGGIETNGVELSATVQMPHQLSLYTAYTLNNSEYVGSGDPLVDANQNIMPGTDVTGVPDRLWVISLDRSGPLTAGISAKYTSPRRVSLVADWTTDEYWMVDAYLTFSGEVLSELLRSTEFSLVANNVLDEAYLSAITENAAWLGASRSVSVTVTFSF
jgi:hypothetical protein